LFSYYLDAPHLFVLFWNFFSILTSRRSSSCFVTLNFSLLISSKSFFSSFVIQHKVLYSIVVVIIISEFVLLTERIERADEFKIICFLLGCSSKESLIKQKGREDERCFLVLRLKYFIKFYFRFSQTCSFGNFRPKVKKLYDQAWICFS
jgi:hypothetical protein